MQPSSFNKAVSWALGKVGKSTMALNDKQLMAIHCTAHLYGKCVFVWLPTDTASTHVRVLPFVFVPRIHFGKYRSGIPPLPFAELQATFLQRVAAHCNRIFNRLFLRVIIYLHILTNYIDSVAELLMHTRQWITGAPLQFLSSAWERGYI